MLNISNIPNIIAVLLSGFTKFPFIELCNYKFQNQIPVLTLKRLNVFSCVACLFAIFFLSSAQTLPILFGQFYCCQRLRNGCCCAARQAASGGSATRTERRVGFAPATRECRCRSVNGIPCAVGRCSRGNSSLSSFFEPVPLRAFCHDGNWRVLFSLLNFILKSTCISLLLPDSSG
jgi:hypothetical protein